MRAKILMLSDGVREKNMLLVPQQALSDIAVAFGHSFIMKAQQMNDQQLPAESADCSAVLAFVPEESLRSVFDLDLRITSLTLPQGLSDFSLLRIPQFPALTLISPLKAGLACDAEAARRAFRMTADEEGAMLWAVAGREAGLWDQAVIEAAGHYTLSIPEVLPLSAAISKPLQYPGRHHVLLADPAEAELIAGLYRGLSGAGLAHSAYIGSERRVHVPGGVPGYVPGLFDGMYATAALIEDSLKLKKEAGCLKASVDNVLASGWRARDMDIEGEAADDKRIAALIGEQIELAGSLMQRFPG